MRNLEARFSVPQSPDQVWSVLIDYPSYARWNSFMREASGEVGVGKKLNITIYLSSGSGGDRAPLSAPSCIRRRPMKGRRPVRDANRAARARAAAVISESLAIPPHL
jgi:hypothetical protein